jgi:predicted CoA-binding protein
MSAQTSQSAVNDFIAQKSLALVGVSRNPKKFGSLAFHALKTKGYRLFPVNRNLERIEDLPCYPDLQSLPEKVDGVLIVVPPKETEQVVKQADAIGIKRVWMQQGSESESAIQFCREHGIEEVHGECILMFAKPVQSYHRFHRLLMGLLGKLPRNSR